MKELTLKRLSERLSWVDANDKVYRQVYFWCTQCGADHFQEGFHKENCPVNVECLKTL